MNASTDPEVLAMNSEPSAPLGIGARLAQARQAKALSLGDIARQLKLTVKQVEALERDDHASFGSMVFVRGFLRGYAKFVQVDIADDLARLEPAAPAQPSAGSTPARPVPLRRGSRAPVWTIAGAVSLIGVVGVFVAAHQMGKDSPAGDPPSALSAKLSAPPVTAAAPVARDGAASSQAPASAQQDPAATAPSLTDGQSVVQSSAVAVDGTAAAPTAASASATAGAPATAATAATSTLPTASDAPLAAKAATPASTSEPVVVTSPTVADGVPAPLASGPEVKLVFEADAWVEARDRSGMVVFSQMNKAGSEQVVRGEGPLSLVVGNARHVRVSYHGAPIDLGPHTRLDVARLTLK